MVLYCPHDLLHNHTANNSVLIQNAESHIYRLLFYKEINFSVIILKTWVWVHMYVCMGWGSHTTINSNYIHVYCSIAICHTILFSCTPALGPVTGLEALNNTFTAITLTWQPPPDPNGVTVMYQVTYSYNGSVNTYSTTTPPLTITELVPMTTYTFSVVGYTISGPGTPQKVQTSTAAIREYYSTMNYTLKYYNM